LIISCDADDLQITVYLALHIMLCRACKLYDLSYLFHYLDSGYDCLLSWTADDLPVAFIVSLMYCGHAVLTYTCFFF
jgi:hypothetical protein